MDINFTYLALISKVNSLAIVSEFRSISLCIVLYKIVSKVLVNKLKEVIPSIISSCQSALISRRIITNNIIVAYETL